ncbi:MAG: hypothetical protein ABWK53_04915 [Anaerolineales bacterium]
MNKASSPRPFIAAILTLILLTWLIGGLQAFSSVRAAGPASRSAALLRAASPTATRQATCAPRTATPSATPTATPTVPAAEGPRSADTTGIVAFAVLMVVIVLFGVFWARPRPLRKPRPASPRKGRTPTQK